MAKKVIRSAVIFGGIIAIFPLCYFIYTFFTVGEGSYWIFGIRDGVTWVSAWVDKNANGIREEDEPSLPGVCIWSGYQQTTDLASNGCSAQFGFVENGVKVSHKILSINDFARRKNTILWVERIGIGLFMLMIAGIGTYWLEKR